MGSTIFQRASKRGKVGLIIFLITSVAVSAYFALSHFGFENGLYVMLIIPAGVGLLTFYERGYLPLKKNTGEKYPHTKPKYGSGGSSSSSDREPMPSILRHEVFHRDKYRCKECGATNNETQLEVDHIKPVSKGGTNDLHNLQTLCKKCNRSKHTRWWKGGKTKRF